MRVVVLFVVDFYDGPDQASIEIFRADDVAGIDQWTAENSPRLWRDEWIERIEKDL